MNRKTTSHEMTIIACFTSSPKH